VANTTAIDILLCYRGRYQPQVRKLDALLAANGLRVTYDSKILSPDTEYFNADVEWMSLGASGEETSVAWRGPVSAAVKQATLLVFLVNPRDPSVNVMNEIGWGAQSGKPLFVVFDNNRDSDSETWEAVNIGYLQAFYGIATMKPGATPGEAPTGTLEIPSFGYAFVKHDADDGLDQRLTILVDRIISYLRQARLNAIDTTRLDNKITAADVENAPESRARRRLYDAQEKISLATGSTPAPAASEGFQQTLDRLYAREREAVLRDGRIYPPRTGLSYPEKSERERYRRTEALIKLLRPGAYEYPDFLEMLVRELVSVEMVQASAARRAVLIGTVPLCPSNIPIDLLLDPDYAVLIADSTRIDFVYFMANAAVACWQDTYATLLSRPALVGTFATHLRDMLERGFPGDSGQDSIPAALLPARELLVTCAMRFYVAVAVARTTLLGGISKPSDGVTGATLRPTDWITLSDALASRWVIESALLLDGVEPALAIEGVMLALASQLLIEKFLKGFDAPEKVSASTRMELVCSEFDRSASRVGTSLGDAPASSIGSHRVPAIVDLLWQVAVDSGKLDLSLMKPAPRWFPRATQ
jgi:hypothetical protein